MATSAEEPQPCDMESPMRSLGFHSSQVKVPPTATMWAQPGMEASVSVCTTASGRPAAASAAQELEAVVGPDVDAEARHVGRRPRRGRPPARRRRPAPARWPPARRGRSGAPSASTPSTYDAVGPPQHGVDRRRQLGRPRLVGLRAPASSPARAASCATRLNAFTASTLLAVSAATERS